MWVLKGGQTPHDSFLHLLSHHSEPRTTLLHCKYMTPCAHKGFIFLIRIDCRRGVFY